MISLTRRITLGTVVLTAGVVGVAVIVVWTAARWQAVRALDGELSAHASHFRVMAPHLGSGPGDGPRPPPWMDRRPPPPEMGRILLRIIAPADGRDYFRSSADDALADVLTAGLDGTPAWYPQADGRILRGLRATAPDAPEVVGAFALDATATIAEFRRLGLTLLAVWLVASCLAIAAAWWLRRSVIGPVRRLTAAIGAVGPGSTRVQAEVPLEMTPVVSTLNELLARQAAVLAREQGTIANIAHELRSPISGLRTTLEVAALDAGSGGSDLAARCLPTVVAMHGMVVNLLALARLEAGQERIALSDLPLEDLLVACWATLRPAADQRRLRLERSGPGGMLRTCPEQARIVLGNLLDNAVSHAPEGGVLGVISGQDGGMVRLRITNPIAGEAPDPARVFEPFWRGDSARSSPQHSGLGLALARRITTLLGGELRVEVGDGRFTVHLGLPAAG